MVCSGAALIAVAITAAISANESQRARGACTIGVGPSGETSEAVSKELLAALARGVWQRRASGPTCWNG
eukprot:3076322-Amphidinium_carterae.1